MIYSKRRKNLGGGHTKRSNRKFYGLKRYSKNIANISGYRQKGGGMTDWSKILKKKSLSEDELKKYLDKLYSEYRTKKDEINAEYDVDPINYKKLHEYDTRPDKTVEELQELQEEEVAIITEKYNQTRTALLALQNSSRR